MYVLHIGYVCVFVMVFKRLATDLLTSAEICTLAHTHTCTTTDASTSLSIHIHSVVHTQHTMYVHTCTCMGHMYMYMYMACIHVGEKSFINLNMYHRFSFNPEGGRV
jgi:hypothetical protein